jgi:hypothetical protein
MSNENKCTCQCIDARQCFLARYPACRRNTDGRHLYDETMFEECECSCHSPSFTDDEVDDYLDSLGIDMQPAFDRLHAIIKHHKEASAATTERKEEPE